MIECKNIDEVRVNIDIIDREIVKLLSERSKYVRQAAKFKKNTDDVKAPKRVEEVIEKVRNLALEYGSSPEIVEQIYRTMIDCFIDYEMKEHSPSTAKK
jgi:isochorismate pyruvate lyase